MNCRQSIEEDSNEECDMINTDTINFLTPQTVQFDTRLNPTQNDEEVRDLVLHKSASGIISVGRPTTLMVSQRKFIFDLLSSRSNSTKSINISINALRENHMANVQKKRNRDMGNDALSIVLSALYAKFIFVLGIAFPITGIVADKAPTSFYEGFYLFLYSVSVLFVIFVYSTHLKNRQVFSMIDQYEERTGDTKLSTKKRIIRYGSFYLRVGAIAFGIGSMVYSGLEFGQYFELKEDDRCQNILIAVNPAARMLLTIVQMQFIFLNTKELNMRRYKVISRFGLMHLIATNLCEWIYVLVEETKHEIENLMVQHSLNNSNATITSHLIHKRATSVALFVECKRTNIMGRLVQKAAPFLFPCTIEYSLICAVILYEMWKKIKMRDPSVREHQDSIMGHHRHKDVRQLSVDCSKAHRGMFAGILVIVLTIISLIMFYVLKDEKLYKATAVVEVTYCEFLLYSVTCIAVLLAMRQMRDMKFSKLYVSGIGLDCTLLVLAQSGVFIYSMFSLLGCYFTYDENPNSLSGLITEMLSLIQTSIQTIFILNAWWRRTKGTKQSRTKPGREIITFLIVANMAIWFINCLIKNRASFRPTHLNFFGEWSWTIITHTSMPLAIFYRFHSTICLFEIWKTSYKLKEDVEDKNQMQH